VVELWREVMEGRYGADERQRWQGKRRTGVGRTDEDGTCQLKTTDEGESSQMAMIKTRRFLSTRIVR
jgi:protocatechuate 3,4-dioxygenase beta subunit